MANARVEPKGNAIILTKQASGFAKIDLLTAALTRYEFMLLRDQRQAQDRCCRRCPAIHRP